MTDKISKLLIANRGEISLRIQQSCKRLGIGCVAVMSEADRHALFTRTAEEAFLLGPADVSLSYLNIDRIIEAARQTGCNAIHPGYGFLSENSEFVKRVNDEGLIFVGPRAESVRLLGSKTLAREAVAKGGVPCPPGSPSGCSDKELEAHALEIGYPVIIKATGGGGGRGMRVVRNKEQLKELLPRTRAEAGKNFGNQDVYLEKYIEGPRHVEVQVMADHHGNVLHFGTRDCSLQRRHQKVVEEAPAPDLSPELRGAIEQAAVNAAKSVDYWNAGTVEFLVSDNNFYFLEMNTRIQVEHPVTEAVYGVDLIELQIRVAQGEELSFNQSEIEPSGHALEFRVYAEDPENNFAPAAGKITAMVEFKAEWFREDKGFEAGDQISPFYDAMISKLIVWGETRAQAVERSVTLLDSYQIEGLKTNLEFHRWLLGSTPFVEAPVDTGFLDRTDVGQEIKNYRNAAIVDPQHTAPIGDFEYKQLFHYVSQKFDCSYTIELVHMREGGFLAVPYSPSGRQAREEHCRRSNGLKTALESLKEEVLEQFSPEEVFGGG